MNLRCHDEDGTYFVTHENMPLSLAAPVGTFRLKLHSTHTHGLSDFDPEDLEKDDDDAAAREHYVDVGPSTLRDGVLDSKYDGQRTTRKSLIEESEDEEEYEEEPSESEHEDEDDEEDEHQHQHESESEEDQYEDKENDVSADLKRKREDDKRKGKAVSRQIVSVSSLVRSVRLLTAPVGHLGCPPRSSDTNAKGR